MIQYFFTRKRNMPSHSILGEPLFGHRNLTQLLRETETEIRFWWQTCRAKIAEPAQRVPVTSTSQETPAAEGCRTLRNTSSSAASARKSRIGRCAKRKRFGGECASGKSQVSVLCQSSCIIKFAQQHALGKTSLEYKLCERN